MASIEAIGAREILDSRGNPTVEVEVALEDGATGPSLAIARLPPAPRASVRSAEGLGSFRRGLGFVPPRAPLPSTPVTWLAVVVGLGAHAVLDNHVPDECPDRGSNRTRRVDVLAAPAHDA